MRRDATDTFGMRNGRNLSIPSRPFFVFILCSKGRDTARILSFNPFQGIPRL